MKNKNHRKRKHILYACLLLSLTGCSAAPQTAADGQDWQEDWTRIGPALGVEAPQGFTLLDNKDALAADGLYYATWVTGDSSPYENSDGETIDLYDAQLYLLTSETKDGKSAEKNYRSWLASAEDNYKVLTRETITCNGQPYTIITYDCIGEDTPYDRGVSALGVSGASAVCAELTCTENYEEDLTSLLTDFLDGCHYSQTDTEKL